MGNRDVNARAYLSRFNFSGADQEKLCGMLSGGERNRLHLAMALKEEGNVLLLDEPTNDIDVNTLRAMEEGLEDFAGCAVVISHDRWFLDRICTHILAFEGNSEVFYFEGSYTEYEANKLKRLGAEEPKRVRYRKLKRKVIFHSLSFVVPKMELTIFTFGKTPYDGSFETYIETNVHCWINERSFGFK